MGQSKKFRSCPSVSREISAAECGEHRQVRYVCPEVCGFNPFAPGISMDDVGPLPGLETIDACIEHLGGPAERLHQRRWLAENFVRINEVLTATGLERRQPALIEGLASLLVSGAKQAPKDRAPRPEVMLVMVAVLRVLLDELDMSLRRQSAI
jgi:hypothetical protein